MSMNHVSTLLEEGKFRGTVIAVHNLGEGATTHSPEIPHARRPLEKSREVPRGRSVYTGSHFLCYCKNLGKWDRRKVHR